MRCRFAFLFEENYMVENLLVTCMLVHRHTAIEVSHIFGKAKMICDWFKLLKMLATAKCYLFWNQVKRGRDETHALLDLQMTINETASLKSSHRKTFLSSAPVDLMFSETFVVIRTTVFPLLCNDNNVLEGVQRSTLISKHCILTTNFRPIKEIIDRQTFDKALIDSNFLQFT